MVNISPRLDLVKAYFSPSRNFSFSMFDLVKGVIKLPCTRIGPKFIEQIDDDGEYLSVKIRTVSARLFWPRVLPMFDLCKVVTECFYEADWHFYEVQETQVSSGDVVLDCGAAEGIFSLRVLERAGHIVIFEPQPLFVSSLERTFAQNSKVIIVPHALGSSEGEAFLEGDSLYGRVMKNSQNGRGIPVKVTTIDEWAKGTHSRVDLIKGDLESSELEVLHGGKETIKRYKPKIAFTVYHPINDWKQILFFLRGLVPEYAYRIKGLSYNGKQARPVMIHLWPK